MDSDAPNTSGPLPVWALKLLACPACRDPLTTQPATLVCSSCARVFAITFGIADLRLTPDPYLSDAEDRAAALRLYEKEQELTFEPLLRSYYQTNAKVSPQRAAQFAGGAIAAAGRSREMLEALQPRAPIDSSAPFLDLGCGTGSLAVDAARRGYQVLAVDVGLRWLILARARAREAGVQVLPICANAESLPFADASLGVVAGESILENVRAQPAVVHAIARVLRDGGHAWLSVPNKYSPAPDPHLGLPFGGVLSDRLSARVATRRGDVPPVRRMLGLWALRSLVTSVALEWRGLRLPVVAQSQRKNATPAIQWAIGVYDVCSRVPGLRQLLMMVTPTWIVVAQRGRRL